MTTDADNCKKQIDDLLSLPQQVGLVGAGLRIGVLLGLCGAVLQKSVTGGLVVVRSLDLRGLVEPLCNAVEVAELAIDKGAETLRIPVSARRQLLNLPDDLATKINIQCYSDSKEALVKALAD